MYDYYQYYSQPQPEYYTNSVLNVGALALTLGFLVVMVAVGMFVLKGFALYRLAENRKMENAFLSFIPFANFYYLGKITDDINATMSKKTDNALKLTALLSAGLLLVCSSLPFCLVFAALSAYFMMSLSFIFCMIGCLTVFCFYVYYFACLNVIFKEYVPSSSTLCLVFSILLGIAPIILFAIRENESGYSKWQKSQQQTYTAYDMPLKQKEIDEVDNLEDLVKILEEVDVTDSEQKTTDSEQ